MMAAPVKWGCSRRSSSTLVHKPMPRMSNPRQRCGSPARSASTGDCTSSLSPSRSGDSPVARLCAARKGGGRCRHEFPLRPQHTDEGAFLYLGQFGQTRHHHVPEHTGSEFRQHGFRKFDATCATFHAVYVGSLKKTNKKKHKKKKKQHKPQNKQKQTFPAHQGIRVFAFGQE